MRPRTTFVKILSYALLLWIIYYIRFHYLFQKALSSSSISFSDLPLSYATALNVSGANDEALVNFDYANSFPSAQIPRTIHFIYFADLYHLIDGTSSLSAETSLHAPSLCREFNPAWEIRIWDASGALALLETRYAWFLPTYVGYRHPIQRIDALKYFVLYEFGGIYMDLDIACRRPLEPLLGFPAWFPQASPLGINNDLMASTPKHPILRQMTVALRCRNWDFGIPYFTVFWSTGPQFASDVERVVEESFWVGS